MLTNSDSGGRISLDEFHNGLRILLNLDFRDLVQARVFLPDDNEAWQRFQRDPFRFFIRADEEVVDRIWDLIQSRQPERRAA